MPAGLTRPAAARAGSPARRRRARARRRAAAGLLLFAALCVGFAGRAAAQPAAGFTAEEQAIIARNASLKAALATAPAAVRQALDAIAAAQPAGTARSGPPLAQPEPAPRVEDKKARFKRKTDPDLAGLERISPEAAHDLFQVLKQVGSTKPAGQPR